MKILIFKVLIAISFLQGCANTAINIRPDYKPSPNTHGLIYGTLSKEGGADAWVFVKKKGSEENIRLEAVGVYGNIGEINSGEEKGNLFAVELEPGVYVIDNWMLFAAGYNKYFYFAPEPPSPHEIEVKSNQVTYIGSFNIKALTGKNFFGFPLIVGAIGQVRDEAERDTGFLYKKYPQLKELPMRNLTPPKSIWSNQTVIRK